MESLILTLVGITSLFFIMLAFKSVFNLKKVCAICASVALTWVALLILYFLNIFRDKIIIGILMGMTALGIYYAWEKNVSKNILIFRLPLLITFIFIIYSVLEKFILEGFIFLLVLWAIFFITYLFKNNRFANKLIECCGKW